MKRQSVRLLTLFLTLGGWAATSIPARAQQSLRPSLSSPGDQTRTQFAATGYDYNLKLGPAFVTLGTSLGFEYNDNINLADSAPTPQIIQESAPQKITVVRVPAQPAQPIRILPGGIIIPGRPAISAQTEEVTIPGTRQTVQGPLNPGPKSDFIYRPQITIHTIWPATKLNVLTFDIGLGVERHLNHPEYNQTNITVSPNTQLSFDLYVGNVRFNFHDRLAISQNAASRSDVSNTGPYSQTTNVSGVNALWDLNKTILQAGYDYSINHYTGTSFQDQSSNSHIFNASIAFPIAASLYTGLQSNYILTDYVDRIQPDITTVSIGPFLQVSPSRYTRIEASAGYQVSSFHLSSQTRDNTLFVSSSSNSSQQGGSFYYSVSLQNQLNRFLQQGLTIARERELGLNTNLLETQSFRYNLQWRLNSRVTLSADASYQIGKQNTGFTDENFDYYGGGFSFGYQFTRHLSAAFHYENTQRSSNLLFRNYSQNIAGLEFRYDF